MDKSERILQHIVLVLVLFLTDQLTKLYVQYTGGDYFLHELPPYRIVIMFLALSAMLWFYISDKTVSDNNNLIDFLKLSLVVTFSGGLGNFADVILHRGVVDFISFNIPMIGTLYTNLADIYLVGAILVGITSILIKRFSPVKLFDVRI